MSIASIQAHARALPQLAVALDPQSMTQRLSERLWASPRSARRDTVADCTITHVRHRVLKQRCVIGYRLQLTHAEPGSPREIHLAARMYAPGTSSAAFARATLQPQAPAPWTPPLFRLADLDMIVWAFPNDHKLTGLRTLGGLDGVRELLPRLASQLGEHAHQSAIELVHYVPEHGCTVRITSVAATVYAKFYAAGASERAHDVLTRLWHSDERRAGTLRMPEPLLHLPESDLIVCRAIPGQTLLERCARNEAGVGTWRDAASAIAALHRTPLPKFAPLTLASVEARLDQVASVAAELAPASASAIVRLAERLRAHSSIVDFAEHVTLHGDLHPQNILIDDARAALLDFDAVTAGPAVMDLGSFHAALLYQSLLNDNDPEPMQAAMTQFASAYRQCAAAHIDPLALRWSTAFALLAERAYRCMVRMKPGRTQLIDGLVRMAHGLLQPERSGVRRSAIHE